MSDTQSNADDKVELKTIVELENKIKSLNSYRVLNRLIFDSFKNPLILYDRVNDSILMGNNYAAKFFMIDVSELTKFNMDALDPFLMREINNLQEKHLHEKVNLVYEKILPGTTQQKLYEVSISPIKIGNKFYSLIEILNLDEWNFTKDSIKSEISEEIRRNKRLLEEEIEKRKLAETKLNTLTTKINLITSLKSSFFYTLRVISTTRYQLVESSKTFKKLTGYDLRDVEDLGGWFSIINNVDLPLYHKMKSKLAPNELISGEYRVVDKNGENLWLRDYIIPQFDESGRFIQFIFGFAEDITKLKKLEEEIDKMKDLESRKEKIDLSSLKINLSNKVELKEALDSYQSIVMRIFPYHIFHENGLIIDANIEFQELTGLHINPLNKKTLFEIFDTSKRTEYLRYIQLNLSDFFEVKIKDKNGFLLKFEALNIMCDHNNSMVKLLALKNPVSQ